MASKFECEIRFNVEDIHEFENKLNDLEAKVLFEYEFTDYYYKPKSEEWNPINKNIRIRHWHFPSRGAIIYFVKNEIIEEQGMKFKRSLLEEGKLQLFTGSLEKCKEILNDLEFIPWKTIEKKNCKIWNFNDIKPIVEFIPGYGWSCEIEVEGGEVKEAANKLKKALEILGVKEYSFEPVCVMINKTKRQ